VARTRNVGRLSRVQVGDVVAGRYELVELLGVGGMASVYRAHDRVLERDVALKVLDERHGDDAEQVERFRREARAIARLSHPNIVTVIDRGETDGRQFIVFEHVPGQNLKQLLQARGPLPVAQALALAHQAARGLAAAHANGIVHRDVKPQNVLVDRDGVAKVTDFGIARAGDGSITLTGTILGTGDYISPEQAAGRPVDERSDQYSLGVLLFELLTGEVPYAGDTTLVVASKHVNEPVPSVRERRRDVASRVDDLVRRAMAKSPEDRFPSMDALVAALEACMGEAQPPPGNGDATEILRAKPAARRVEAPRRRRRLPYALLAGLSVLGAGAIAVWALASGRFDPGEAGGGGQPVRLTAIADYDPFPGDDREHPELLAGATDGDRQTYWRTERYNGGLEAVGKPGVGIVLDARRRRALEELVVVSETPGFSAVVQAGPSPTGPFRPISDELTVEGETTFELDGPAARYYLLWVTDLDEVAHLNEVRAA
jgi:hypothetical protein